MTIEVIVHTNSKRPRVLKDNSGLLHIYVGQPPVDDKANKAIIACLAEYFNVSKSKVELISGHKSKKKIISIEIK